MCTGSHIKMLVARRSRGEGVHRQSAHGPSAMHEAGARLPRRGDPRGCEDGQAEVGLLVMDPGGHYGLKAQELHPTCTISALTNLHGLLRFPLEICVAMLDGM